MFWLIISFIENISPPRKSNLFDFVSVYRCSSANKRIYVFGIYWEGKGEALIYFWLKLSHFSSQQLHYNFSTFYCSALLCISLFGGSGVWFLRPWYFISDFIYAGSLTVYFCWRACSYSSTLVAFLPPLETSFLSTVCLTLLSFPCFKVPCPGSSWLEQGELSMLVVFYWTDEMV